MKTKLTESIKPDYYEGLSLTKKKKLQVIEEWNFDILCKKMLVELEKGTINYEFPGELPGNIYQGLEQLKRYYAVSILEHERGTPHAISQHVDPFWHMHIIFTIDYRAFCDRVFGRYLNHVPLDFDEKTEVEEIKALYDRTVEIQKRIFKRVNYAWWPRTRMGRCIVICKFF